MSTSAYRNTMRVNWTRRHGVLRARRNLASGAERVEERLGPRQLLRRQLFERILRDIEAGGTASFANAAEAETRVRYLLNEGLESALLTSLSDPEREQLVQAVLAELSGYGPLDPLMKDPTISDVLVNGPFEVWIDRFGNLEQTNVRFDDEEHLQRIVSRLISGHGRHLEEATAYVDARLPDGSRLHAMLPPISTQGTVLAIRRKRAIPLRLEQILAYDTLSTDMSRFLQAAVRSQRNILISGGAASGKTTMLATLSRFIPHAERIVTIEETAELHLDHPHVVPLETRLPNVEGRGEVNLRTLVRNALRLRADRIIVDEVRGSEVFDMLQAMNIGHAGSLTTVHANSPEEALRRLETLVLLAGFELPSTAIRDLLGAAFDLIVHMTRFPDGSRRVTSIGEVVSAGNDCTAVELFRYEHQPSRDGEPTPELHVPTGHVPAFVDHLAEVDPGIRETILKDVTA